MSKQTLIDELTKEVNQAKSTYQECDDDLSKRIFETKIRAYSHALDLANYHIHDDGEKVDINHIESVVMNVINDFTEFVKPNREANAFVFDMLKKSIRLALQEYNLNGGWISVDDMLPKPEQEINYLDDSFEPKNFYLVQLKNGLIDTVYYATICDDCEYSDIFISCTVNVKENRYCVQERGFNDYRINEVKYWQPIPQPPKE